VIVIIVYLLYLTLRAIQTNLVSPSTYYDLLQVSPSIDEAGLKSAWRSMSRKYHPDKLGAGGAQGERWVQMREGYEILMEPNARMAYDRYAFRSQLPAFRGQFRFSFVDLYRAQI
jgi:DnaJ-class molecular chaperone